MSQFFRKHFLSTTLVGLFVVAGAVGVWQSLPHLTTPSTDITTVTNINPLQTSEVPDIIPLTNNEPELKHGAVQTATETTTTNTRSTASESKSESKNDTAPVVSVPTMVKAELTIIGPGINLHYQQTVAADSSVDAVMRQINNKHHFGYHTVTYPGLGEFVDKLGGVKAELGRDWIFYFNGKKSILGVSNQIIKTDATIMWKYEKDD